MGTETTVKSWCKNCGREALATDNYPIITPRIIIILQRIKAMEKIGAQAGARALELALQDEIMQRCYTWVELTIG